MSSTAPTIAEIISAYQSSESSPDDTLLQIYNESLPPFFDSVTDFVQWLQDAKRAEQYLKLSGQISNTLRQTLMLGVIDKLEPAWAKIFGDWIEMSSEDWEIFLTITIFEEYATADVATLVKIFTMLQLTNCLP